MADRSSTISVDTVQVKLSWFAYLYFLCRDEYNSGSFNAGKRRDVGRRKKRKRKEKKERNYR